MRKKLLKTSNNKGGKEKKKKNHTGLSVLYSESTQIKPQKWSDSFFTQALPKSYALLVFNQTQYHKYEFHLAALKTKFEVNHYGQ